MPVDCNTSDRCYEHHIYLQNCIVGDVLIGIVSVADAGIVGIVGVVHLVVGVDCGSSLSFWCWDIVDVGGGMVGVLVVVCAGIVVLLLLVSLLVLLVLVQLMFALLQQK